MMHIRIRRAQPADSDALTDIAHAAKRYWGYSEELMRLWQKDLTVTASFIKRQPVYCALRGRTIVGFCALSGSDRVRELEHMWVHPSHMRAGVGRLLFEHLIEGLRAMRVTQLRVASDPNAEGFYRRMGAKRVGTTSSSPPGRMLPLLLVRVPPKSRLTKPAERTPTSVHTATARAQRRMRLGASGRDA